MVGEVARGLSLFGGASSEVRRCICSVVDESRSSLAARCVSFYQTVCLSVCHRVCLSRYHPRLLGVIRRSPLRYPPPRGARRWRCRS